jgi:hypothetical protein
MVGSRLQVLADAVGGCGQGYEDVCAGLLALRLLPKKH